MMAALAVVVGGCGSTDWPFNESASLLARADRPLLREPPGRARPRPDAARADRLLPEAALVQSGTTRRFVDPRFLCDGDHALAHDVARHLALLREHVGLRNDPHHVTLV